MAKFLSSKFALTKRYYRFSNICVFLFNRPKKSIRYGYKFYQKIFRGKRSKGVLRINVKKPRIATKAKTPYGRALEIKQKFSYLLGGIHTSKLSRFCRINRTQYRSSYIKFYDFLESRLDLILYRSNLVYSPFLSRSIIEAGYVKVNGKVVNFASYRVKKNDVVDISLPAYLYKHLLSVFKIRRTRRLIFQVAPRYMEISYKIFRILIWTRPKPRQIYFPFKFDIHYFFSLYQI